MAGIDDNVTLNVDWGLPCPSPRSLFSRMLDGDNGSGGTGAQDGDSGAQLSDTSYPTEHKSSSRGGLVERIAARAGFNAPRLNTESIRSTDLSLNSEIQSPYLTIPPGLSPTTLLDSPVFLANSLVSSMFERLRRRICVVVCLFVYVKFCCFFSEVVFTFMASLDAEF